MTQSQEKFAVEVSAGKSYAESARNAGYAVKNARIIGSRLAHDPEVVARIQELKRQLAEPKVTITLRIPWSLLAPYAREAEEVLL